MTRARDAVAGQKGEVNEAGCDNTNITTKALMDILETATLMLSQDTDKLKAGAEEWLRGLRKRILEGNCSFTEADQKKELQRKDKLLDAYLDGIITKADYALKLEAIEDKLEAIKEDLAQNEKKLEDIREIDRLLENMDQTIAEYLDENQNLGIEFILEKMSGVVIYPDAVKIQLPSFSKEIVVEKIQFVKDRNAGNKRADYFL